MLFNFFRLQRFEFNCTETCDCDMNKFSPVCGSNGMTYYSSCHAGCKASTTINGRIEFTNCTCIENSPSLLSSIDGSMLGKPDAISGFCGGECKSYILFISLFSFFVFMHSTSEVGSILLIMRCTDPKGTYHFYLKYSPKPKLNKIMNERSESV